MEVGEITVVNGREFTVVSRYFRTKGSRGQRLTSECSGTTESRRTFYVVECGGELLWVKEYTDPEYGAAPPHAEYDRMVSCNGIVLSNEIASVRSVRPVFMEDNRIFMEYCEGYEKISMMYHNLREDEIDGIARILEEWLAHEGTISDFDMSMNNIMAKRTKESIQLVLVDLEVSKAIISTRRVFK